MSLIASPVDLGWGTQGLKFSNSGISRCGCGNDTYKYYDIDIERETVESAISTIISQFVRIETFRT